MKNKDEKEIIKAWAAGHYSDAVSEQYLPKIDKTAASYWAEHDGTDDISVHGFETVPELKKDLVKWLADEELNDLILPLAIACFKEKDRITIRFKSLEEQNDDEFNIPEFIYTF